MTRDRRVWTPDESCQPWHIETVTDNVNYAPLKWRVPNGQAQVITSVYTAFDGGGALKTQMRFLIGLGDYNSPAVNKLDGAIKTTGALEHVEELGGTGLSNTPGFILGGFGGGLRPCRIVLEGGYSYFLQCAGTFALNVGIIMLDGYTFPLRPRQGDPNA